MAELEFRSPVTAPAPVDADDVATRGYVDDALDATVTQVALGSIVYGTNLEAQQSPVPYSSDPEAFHLVMRDFGGDFTVNAPSVAANPATKQYVDDAVAAVPAAPVTSVNGDVGAVVLDAADVGAAPTVHTHPASAVVSGTLDAARLPRTTGAPRTQAHAATVTIDASLGSLVNIAATADETINAPTNGTDRQILRLAVYCAAARTINFATAIRLSSGLTSRSFPVPAGQVLLAALEFLAVGGLNVWVLTAATVSAT